MRYHSFAGKSPPRPSAGPARCNHSATKMLGCGWHGNQQNASRCDSALIVAVGAFGPLARHPQSAAQRSTDVTKLTQPTDPRTNVSSTRIRRCLLYTSDAADDLLCVD